MDTAAPFKLDSLAYSKAGCSRAIIKETHCADGITRSTMHDKKSLRICKAAHFQNTGSHITYYYYRYSISFVENPYKGHQNNTVTTHKPGQRVEKGCT